MKVLYLIFSHEHQEQVCRLARAVRILSPKSIIAIHHDPHILPLNPDLFLKISDLYIIPNPISGEWGDFSLVEQYLYSFEWSLRNLDFDWIVTLTGLSYPISKLEEFERTLEESGYDAYIHYFNAFDPNHWPAGTGKNRYLFFYLKIPRNPYYYKAPEIIKNNFTKLRVWFNKSQSLIRIIPLPKGSHTRIGFRRPPYRKGFNIFGGRQFLNINKRTLEKVFNFLHNNPSYIRYAKHTIIPDEFFLILSLSTILTLKYVTML